MRCRLAPRVWKGKCQTVSDVAIRSFPNLVKDIHTGCYIDGLWRDATDGRRFVVLNPADEQVLVEVADGDRSDGALALDAADDALSAWASTAPRYRSEILRRAYELMIERREFLAELVVWENGKTLSDARTEVSYAAEFFRWFAEEAVRNYGSVYRAPSGENQVILIHQPIGVSVLVTPWNFPAAMLTRKLAPALGAGCTVVCKPAEDTPLTALAITAILEEAGVPPGVVNTVPTSTPAILVEDWLSDRRVRKVSFTGSTEVGRVLMRQAADGILNCSFELGGNAPFIVFADCDLELAVSAAMASKMRNAGQACTAANRFYVERPIAQAFSERFAEKMGALHVGFGLDGTTEVGPLINKDALDKVSGIVSGAIADGARPLVGGSRRGDKGFFFEPTVLGDVPTGSAILSTEIFGPVAPVSAFDTDEEVLERANDTTRGLVAYVFTGDLARGMRIAERVETGMIGLNRPVISDPATPFGGVKESGLGREGGPGGMAEFLETKYIATNW